MKKYLLVIVSAVLLCSSALAKHINFQINNLFDHEVSFKILSNSGFVNGTINKSTQPIEAHGTKIFNIDVTFRYTDPVSIFMVLYDNAVYDNHTEENSFYITGLFYLSEKDEILRPKFSLFQSGADTAEVTFDLDSRTIKFGPAKKATTTPTKDKDKNNGSTEKPAGS